MIDIRNVSFSYRNAYALDDISLKINKGESIALIGPNGSGKSTFLKLLVGIVFAEKGEYLFEGTIIDGKKMEDSKFSKQFHKRLGFVFQNSDSQLFSPTVYEEIEFAPRQMGLQEFEMERRVNDCLNLLGIYSLKDRAPYNLSGGEKKKVSIASVLSYNPDVIVLDEPMNGLDPKTKRFLREFLIKLNSSGKTIICSTHDFEYVGGVFNRAIVFSEEHKIIRDDAYDVVIQDKKFLEENNII